MRPRVSPLTTARVRDVLQNVEMKGNALQNPTKHASRTNRGAGQPRCELACLPLGESAGMASGSGDQKRSSGSPGVREVVARQEITVASRHVRILVVDDDISFVSALLRPLKRAGAEVLVAYNLADALEIVRTERLDGALIDRMLPDGNGVEVMEALCLLEKPTRTLMVTSDSENDAVRRAHRSGAGFMIKPFSDEDITRFIEAVRHQVAEPPQLSASVLELVKMHGLTPAHGRILQVAAAESAAREVIAERLGLSKWTVKTQVHEILERSGCDSLEALVAPLRAAALRR